MYLKGAGYSLDTSDSGGALVGVVWVVFLLSLFAVGVMLVTLNARQTLNSVEVADADLRIADSALRLFFKEHFYDGKEKAFREDIVPVLGRDVLVQVEIGSGRININRASASLLSALLIVAGSDEELARSQADAIVDWRDKDLDPGPQGAEAEAYQEEGLDFTPRNGPFETVGELRRVLGVDEDLFVCLRPLLTVSSLSADVDLRYAGAEVRSVLQWAYNNDWDDVIWPNPDEIESVGGVLDNATEMGGQTLYVDITVPSTSAKFYKARVRFKSTSDRSFAYLTPLQRASGSPTVRNCPW